ncbi:MAG: hypothetical protein OQL27_10970 [Sedimenticola sp.]|nr:hypothetical protein [Sedimenticola sp.]
MKQLRLLLMFCLLNTIEAYAWNAPPSIDTCIDYHCDIIRTVRLSPEQWLEVRQIFSDNRTAEDERLQIRQAIAKMEQLIGKLNGTDKDLKENDGEGSEIGQLDCIAESQNTTTYLKLIQQDNLLKWHQVGEQQQRTLWLFNIHWTATIIENTGTQRYAVDSWVYANGQPPVIQPIEAWQTGQTFIQN